MSNAELLRRCRWALLHRDAFEQQAHGRKAMAAQRLIRLALVDARTSYRPYPLPELRRVLH